jgi:ABC-2 type transport system permease protein
MWRDHFLLSILAGRMAMMLPEMLLLVLAEYYGFGVPKRGSVLTLGLFVFLGASAFAGMGLLLASRTDKTETISGLINLVLLPMWLLSGTFFSSQRFPDVVQPILQALPLTQLNNALREVMLEEATFTEVAWRAGILAAWALGCFLLALRWFRWQ